MTKKHETVKYRTVTRRNTAVWLITSKEKDRNEQDKKSIKSGAQKAIK